LSLGCALLAAYKKQGHSISAVPFFWLIPSPRYLPKS
jgi:hypothetical protein